MVTMLDAVDVRVDRIVISDLADETFHARLLLVGTDTRHEVDARPSDAIALGGADRRPDLRHDRRPRPGRDVARRR